MTAAPGGTPRVVVVGLGPGSTDHVTVETLAAIERIPHRILRTVIHPSAHLVPGAATCDDLYETADRFADVYAEIAERVVCTAIDHGEVLYAVPGSPLVLERSVRALRADPRIDCRLVPAMSFLDVAWARLGIDPVESGVRLIDGHEFATAAQTPRARCWSRTPMRTGSCRRSSSASTTPPALSTGRRW